MKKQIILSILLLALRGVISFAQVGNPEPPINTSYYGPNAFPVPEIGFGRTSADIKFEIVQQWRLPYLNQGTEAAFNIKSFDIRLKYQEGLNDWPYRQVSLGGVAIIFAGTYLQVHICRYIIFTENFAEGNILFNFAARMDWQIVVRMDWQSAARRDCYLPPEGIATCRPKESAS